MKVERTRFDQAKQEISAMLGQMGGQVSHALTGVMDAFNRLDKQRARQLIEADSEINRQHDRIHDACVTLIATEQPVARELREVVADLQIAAELERMADHVADIARIILSIDERPIPPVFDELQDMANKCREMLNQMLSAHGDRDCQKAAAIAHEDDSVDRLNGQIVDHVISYMQKDTGAVMNGTHVIWFAHNLERIADRITNIAEQVTFMEKGETIDLNRPGIV